MTVATLSSAVASLSLDALKNWLTMDWSEEEQASESANANERMPDAGTRDLGWCMISTSKMGSRELPS
jgi:hypothetical protein